LVMRLASRWPVYPHEDLTQQALCLEVLARGLPARLRVPQVLAVETQGLADTGRPFLLMSRVTGRPAPDRPSYVLEGWLHELSDSERESLWHAGIDAIAAVHACPLTSDETLDLQLPVS